MTFQIIECEQKSDAWIAARLGLVTASEFASVLAKGQGKTRYSYMMKLAGERITGKPMASYTNADMERGVALEPTAREMYSIIANVELKQVGFIRNGDKGCSPDSLIGKKGMLELKTSLPHILIDLIKRDDFPAEHKPQCQGGLLVAERDWIDLAVYCDAPNLPLFVKRAYRDEQYIKMMEDEITRFNDELAEVVEKVLRYGRLEQ
jgi:hypothetical protein